MLEAGLAVRYDGGKKGVAVDDAFAVGDAVRVTGGALAGRRGVVERVTPKKATVNIRGERPRPILKSHLARA